MSKMRGSNFLHLSATALCAMFADTAHSQSPVPIRELSTPEATSTDHFGTILSVRQLAGGKLLVDDGGNRQLLVLDPLLSTHVVLLDSTATATGSYGPRATPLVPYLADSTLFVDGTSLSLLVISPQGIVARVMSAPRAEVVRALAASAAGTDASGNLVFRGQIVATETSAAPGAPTVIVTPDSVAVIHANFDTRQVDTIAKLKVANGVRTELLRDKYDTMHTTRIVNPLVSMDEWAVLSGGKVAVVRGHDYHIDWIAPDKSIQQGAKLPFDWKLLTDADKQFIIDSARTADEAATARATAANAARPPSTEARRSGRQMVEAPTVVAFVPLRELPDYRPAIRNGAVKADADNNLWILPTTSAQSKKGELVYDVVNSAGSMMYRVRLPLGRVIAGFGANGTVYLMTKEPNGWLIERTHVLH